MEKKTPEQIFEEELSSNLKNINIITITTFLVYSFTLLVTHCDFNGMIQIISILSSFTLLTLLPIYSIALMIRKNVVTNGEEQVQITNDKVQKAILGINILIPVLALLVIIILRISNINEPQDFVSKFIFLSYLLLFVAFVMSISQLENNS